ncbi:MAG: asparagine synthase (glutamine-hydrolyzing) [Ilumatobacteraceae bacterium]
MCGIAVISGIDGAEEVRSMLTLLHHRGPDDVGVVQHRDGRVVVGHTRLAIIDPAGGQQPFRGDGGAIAVANCEIYNHQRLLAPGAAERRGSGSDAAILLPLFEELGVELFSRLDGMFAIVIVTDDGTVVAARDPLGIKPLYRATNGDTIAFSSELTPINDGRWEHIETVPPGHVWAGGTTSCFYEPPAPTLSGPVDDAAVAHWCAALRGAVERAVVKRLMSDVPLGTFLSGGLDSSIVSAIAARHVPDLHTFALGFEGSADLEAARLVAAHVGTSHHEIIAGDDEPLEVLPDVLRHLEHWDRDLVRSALPTYLVARFAATELKVVLTGEGADELFAGYRYHADYVDRPAALQRELRRSVRAMHDSNLQRVDRMTMAHSLEARVPFLDPEVVEVAMQIPAELKLRRDRSGRPIEKWILRKAFEDLLPSEIVWRTKSQFDEGSGAVDRLPGLAQAAVDSSIRRPAEARLRDLEEMWYFDMVCADQADWIPIRANTSVWAEHRVPIAS